VTSSKLFYLTKKKYKKQLTIFYIAFGLRGDITKAATTSTLIVESSF
jgi:hypothetical protein